MNNPHKKTAVILFNLGGPDKLENVKPFLFNQLNDKAIIKLPQPLRFFWAKVISSKRAKALHKAYASIGGNCPLLNHSLEQAHSLEKELSYFGDFKTFVAMRYAEPLAKDVVEEVLQYNPDEAILLPLYPQFSTTTSGSSLTDFATRITHQLKQKSKAINLKLVCCYPEEEDLVKSHALLIKKTLLKNYKENVDDFHFLFTAQGIPQRIVNDGDPYVFQIEKTTHKVVEHLAQLLNVTSDAITFQICYQSNPKKAQWTGPSLDLSLKRTVLSKKIPVIIPISVVCEGYETLSELDIHYKKIAQSFGAKNYLRVPALNKDGHFITSLTQICKNISSIDDSRCFSGREKNRICPKKFTKCPNFNVCEK